MEALLVAIAALFTLLVPAVLAAAEAAVLGLSALIELIALLIEAAATGSLEAARKSRREKRQRAAAAPAAPAESKSPFYRAITSPLVTRWTRRITIASSVLLAITVVISLALNFAFFEWFVRLALQGAERRSGIAITFDEASGNLFTGHVELRGARLVRQGNPVSDFDLTINRFDLNADVFKVLAGERVFDDVTAEGVRGAFTKTGKRDPNRPRRDFTVGLLKISDVKITFSDLSRVERKVEVPFDLASLQVADFRSRWTAFDVLFRSTCDGQLGGQPFQITNRPAGELHETYWQGQGLPIHVVGDYFSGPLAWLVDGRLDINATTKWKPADDNPQLDMHCQLVAHDFKAGPPPQLKPVERAMLEPAFALLNRNSANLPLELDLVMHKNDFDGQLTIMKSELMEAIGGAAETKLKDILPRVEERLDSTLDRVRTGVQGIIRRRAEARAAKEQGDGQQQPESQSP